MAFLSQDKIQKRHLSLSEFKKTASENFVKNLRKKIKPLQLLSVIGSQYF